MGLFDLPIETIANKALKKMQPDLEKSIDKSLKDQFDLKAIITDIADFMLVPYQLDTMLGGWMQLQADTAYMTGAKNTFAFSEGKISLITKMNITSAEPTTLGVKPKLPLFMWNDRLTDSSFIAMKLELLYTHMTNVAKKTFVGQTFEDGDKKIKILDINVFSKDNKLALTTKVEGSMKGDITVSGIPKYYKNTQELKVEDLDVKVKSGNKLIQAAAWIMKGKIKGELEKMLYFQLQPQMTIIQQELDRQIEAMNKLYKMKMTCKLGKIDIQDLAVGEEKLDASIGLKFILNTTFDDMAFFRSTEETNKK